MVNYIGAKAREGEKISMTAPVMQSSSDTDNEWVVSFSMPSKYSKKTLPEPNNKQVYSEEVKPIKAAVIRFSGKTDRDGSLIKEKEKVLLDWVKNRDFKIISKSKTINRIATT